MMKFIPATVAALMLSGMFATGCVTSHTESDKEGLLGGHKHEETTTYKNPVTGDTTTEHKTEKTN